MNIALIGATGAAGSRILTEALSRGHSVTGIVRAPDKLPSHPKLTPKAGDINDQAGLASLLKGHDVVASSVHFLQFDPAKLIGAVKTAGVARLLVVGGAGGLEVAPGVRVIDTPEFPEMYRAEASAGIACLDVLKGETQLDWTFGSPSALFAPGPRTGKYRLGADQLLIGPDGNSFVSMEDYAIAFLDEIEKPAHSRRRFTVGY